MPESKADIMKKNGICEANRSCKRIYYYER